MTIGTTRLDLGRIRAAQLAIDSVFLDTPVFGCAPLGQALGCELSVKLETAPAPSDLGKWTPIMYIMSSYRFRAGLIGRSRMTHLVEHESTNS